MSTATVHYTHHYAPYRRVAAKCDACAWEREYTSEGRAVRWAVEHLQSHQQPQQRGAA